MLILARRIGEFWFIVMTANINTYFGDSVETNCPKTITYGTKFAPFLATRYFMQLALREDIYVDKIIIYFSLKECVFVNAMLTINPCFPTFQ